MAEASTAQEIERAITQALAKTGQGGTVIVRDDQCELHSGGPVVAIELGDWVGQWNLLPDDIKENRATKAANRLNNALREAQGKTSPIPKGELVERYRRHATAVVGVFALVLLGLWLHRSGFFGRLDAGAEAAGSAEPVPSGPTHEDRAAREARVRRVCEAARQRMYQGGALGMDIEGWVVELWLARDVEGLLADGALETLVETGVTAQVGAKGVSELSIHAGDTELGLTTAIVRFSEGYVAPFFTPKGREQFMEVAEKIADDVGALHAGLYARCAHLATARDVGAWYRGVDDNGALVSLLYASGRYADPPAFDPAKYAADGLLTKLRQGVAGLDEAVRKDILRRQGGRDHIHKTTDGRETVSLRFPLGGPTRSTSASRDVAGRLGL